MPTFSKTTYEKMAKVISESSSKQKFIDDLVVLFKMDNPKFNEEKFREACKEKYEDQS